MVDINFIYEGSKRIIEVLNQDHLDRWLDKQGMQSLRRDRADGPEVDLFTQLASTKPSGDAMYYYPGPLKTQRQTRRGDANRALGVDVAPEEEQQQRKRQKTLNALVESNAFSSVVKELLDATSRFRGTATVHPKSHRRPYHPLRGTWNEDTLKREVCECRELARTRMKDYKEGDRNPVVVAVRNGSGFGKTHILTEAPDWLNAKGIYVTYNQGQALTVDSEHTAAQAIILRLILVLKGYSPKECDFALGSEEAAPFLRTPVIWLRGLFVSQTKDIGDIAISVDEVRKLPHRAAQVAMSALSNLAAHFYKETHGSMCTVLVSSLNSETFKILSDRALIPWIVERPNHTTLNFFAYLLRREDKERVKALANALGGGHIRSLVYCFKLITEEDMNASMNYLLNRMDQEYGTNIDASDLIAVREHVVDSISSQKEIDVSQTIEAISDANHAVPPCYILKAFEKDVAAAESLRAIFGSFHLYNSPGKQLEEVGKQYDLFRARFDLPVVPGRAEILMPHGFLGNRGWYKDLKFPGKLTESTDALLKVQKIEGSENGKKQVVATNTRPEAGSYYHPAIGNHPWIDRLFLAVHPTNDQACLVIIQDKVNGTDFPEACRVLQNAADLLSKAHGIQRVLLIVNVIGATEATTAQDKLKWPHVLVRGEAEVQYYYSVNFADIVLYARRRHLLSD